MFNSKKGIDDKVSNKLTTLSSQSLIKGDCSIDGDTVSYTHLTLPTIA